MFNFIYYKSDNELNTIHKHSGLTYRKEIQLKNQTELKKHLKYMFGKDVKIVLKSDNDYLSNGSIEFKREVNMNTYPIEITILSRKPDRKIKGLDRVMYKVKGGIFEKERTEISYLLKRQVVDLQELYKLYNWQTSFEIDNEQKAILVNFYNKKFKLISPSIW